MVAAFLALSSVSVLPYMSPRSFGTGQSYSIGAAPSSISVADLNRDGKPDLVMAQRSADRVRVLWGQGGGLFDSSKVTDLTTGHGPVAVALSDAWANYDLPSKGLQRRARYGPSGQAPGVRGHGTGHWFRNQGTGPATGRQARSPRRLPQGGLAQILW